MALFGKINSRAKTEINTGFGTNAADYGGRFVNKTGQPNLEKKGINFFERISWYHTMLTIPNWKFMLLIFLSWIKMYGSSNFVSIVSASVTKYGER